MNHRPEYEIAVTALLKACQLCQNVQKKLQKSDHLTKNDRSPVTIADFGAQAMISLELQRYFPQDLLLAEEDTTLLSKDPTVLNRIIQNLEAVGEKISDQNLFKVIERCNQNPKGLDRYWVLDPVDGTKGFLRGDQYAIALALIENGKVVLGVLGCPNYASAILGKPGALFIAERGNGCWTRGLENDEEKTLKVSEVDDPSVAVFCESVESGHSSHSTSTQIMEMLGTKLPPLRIDSQAKYGAISSGEASVYLRLPTSNSYEEKVWDHAAGSIIVEEAGGKVTDIFGKPLDFSLGKTLKNNRGIICTNNKLHHRVLGCVPKV